MCLIWYKHMPLIVQPHLAESLIAAECIYTYCLPLTPSPLWEPLEVAAGETDTDSCMNLLLLLPAETLAARSQEQMTLWRPASAFAGQSSHIGLKGKTLQGGYKSQDQEYQACAVGMFRSPDSIFQYRVC